MSEGVNLEEQLESGEKLLFNRDELVKILEVRKQLGQLSEKAALYCSDSCISRYLRARNFNVKKACKMLNETLKWRAEYKPEEIRWADIAHEAETGKIYRSKYVDKYGRPVLVMRPRCQNTKSTKGQIKYLVYCMENAVQNLGPDQETMVWLVDFSGFSLSQISLKQTKETAHVLQTHYPERLGLAILYDPPKFFEPFWKAAKVFLEPDTHGKVKFVYADEPNKLMGELFDEDQLESAFGGKDGIGFELTKYAERMKEDDKKNNSFALPSLDSLNIATKS